MERLRIAPNIGKREFRSDKDAELDSLAYVQIDDNGNTIAVFNDDTVMDISDLYSSSMINDYKNHKILVRC